MREVSGPVVAIALVLISVFVPVAFLGGLTGQFYRQFALTLAVSVGISAIVALTFTPALCALLLQAAGGVAFLAACSAASSPPSTAASAASPARYTHTVGGAIRRSALSMSHVRGADAGRASGCVHARPTGFMPDEDQGYLIGLITLPLGASHAAHRGGRRRLQQADARSSRKCENTFAITGLNVLTGTNSSYAATMFTILKPWSQRHGAAHGSLALAARANRIGAR